MLRLVLLLLSFFGSSPGSLIPDSGAGSDPDAKGSTCLVREEGRPFWDLPAFSSSATMYRCSYSALD
jgi:hypothetical protein